MLSIHKIMKSLYAFKALLAATFLFISLIGFTQEYEVEKLDFNTDDAEFSALPYRDGVIFISNRSKKRLAADEDSVHLYYTDIFFSKKKTNGKWSEPVPFAEKLTGFLNEGPATFNKNGTVMYYTGNIEPSSAAKKKKTKEYKLGLFRAEYIDGTWEITEPFPFNSANQQFNIAHPAFSPDDSTLYFASNMPGGIGGADLYKCVWRNDRWSLPINLGNTINTKGDELFPYMSKGGKLFFSSNGYDDSEGFDVYFSYVIANKYQEPIRLPEPINSSLDDFSYCEAKGGNNGYLSSNRENENDDIYMFKSDMPALIDCNDNKKTNYCYHFEDEYFLPNDSLPLAFEWNLGDGTIKRGVTIDYCYQAEGYYHVTLDLIDTLTNSRYYSVSKGEVAIRKLESPYIEGPNEGMVNQSVVFKADGSDITIFEVDEYYWVIDDEIKYSGPELSISFDTPGFHTIVCGAFSKIAKGGSRSSICTYKQIFVTEDPTEYEILTKNEEMKVFQKVDMISSIGKYEVRDNSAEQTLAPYYAVLMESKVKLDPNDPAIKLDGFNVSEFRTEEGYVYAIGPEESPYDLYQAFDAMSAEHPEKVSIQQIDDMLISRIEPIGASRLKVMGLKSPEAIAMKSTFQVMLRKSASALNTDDPLLSQKNLAVNGFRSSDGWVYTTGAETSYESIKPLFEELKNSGNGDAVIVYFDGTNFKELSPAEVYALKEENRNKPSITKGDSTFHIAILRSPVQVPLTDKFFKRAGGGIIEYPVSNGFVYVKEGTTSYENIHSEFEEFVSDGYENAEIVTFDGIDFTPVLTEGEEMTDENGKPIAQGPIKGFYQVLIRETQAPLLPEQIVPGNFEFSLAEIKAGDTYMYTSGNGKTLDAIQPVMDELTKQGLKDLRIVQFDGTGFRYVDDKNFTPVSENTTENSAENSTPTHTSAPSVEDNNSLANDPLKTSETIASDDNTTTTGSNVNSETTNSLENTSQSSSEANTSNTSNTSNTEGTVSNANPTPSIGNTSGAQNAVADQTSQTKRNSISYHVLVKEDAEGKSTPTDLPQGMIAESVKGRDNPYYMYVSGNADTPELLTEQINKLRAHGFADVQIVKYDGINYTKANEKGIAYITTIPSDSTADNTENTTGIGELGVNTTTQIPTENTVDASTTSSGNKEYDKLSKPKMSYHVLLQEDGSGLNMPTNLPAEMIVEIKPNASNNGFLYLTGNADSPEKLMEVIASLKKAGFDKVEVAGYDGVQYIKVNEQGTPFIELVPTESNTASNSSNTSITPGPETNVLTHGTTSSEITTDDTQNVATKGSLENRKPMFHIVIGESVTRIPFNDPYFSKIEGEIIEIKTETGYKYVTGASTAREKLHPVFEEIVAENNFTARIEEFDQMDFTSKITKTGSYIAPKDADILNIEFAKLSDIKFEYNSAEIKDESKQVLNYVAAMLILEEDFILRINAHTCSQGGDEYNQVLSERRAESVKNYFMQRGIDGTRLLKKGFGENRPLVDNTEEDGRKLNRRVEFIIVFTDQGQGNWIRSND
jgi:outer membrane protein OmpA-like peptidoglycan-associated protein